MKRSYLVALGITALTSHAVAQTTLYEQNFEGASTSSGMASGGGYIVVDNISGTGWQVQGGTDEGAGGSVSLTAGVNTSGAGGSQALFGAWDLSSGVNFAWNQYTFYGVPGAGPGRTLADIGISLDISVSGAVNATPITITARQDGVDADLNFTPALANDTYTSVSYTLDQATAAGAGTFDPTAAFWLRLNTGNGGFGFDADNMVQVDNVLIAAVPEPTTGTLVALGLVGAALLGRRHLKKS